MKSVLIFLVSMLILFCLVACDDTSYNDFDEELPETNYSESTSCVEEDSFIIDYEDAATFEKALNNGEKVKGKYVKFLVNKYVPDSSLGINCWAGDHLNFISKIKLDVKSGDTIVAYITGEAKTVLFDSWKIPISVIDIIENNNSEPSSAVTTTQITTVTTTEAITLSKNQAYAPESAYLLDGNEVEDVVNIFKEAKFKNINKVPIYDLDYTSFWDRLYLNDVESVSINGINDFEDTDVFDKSAPVIIEYHAFEKDNPNIVYNKYTVSQLFDDLEKNPMRAEDKHLYEHIEVKGRISEISSNGNYILICDVNDAFALKYIYCKTDDEQIKKQIYDLSTGDVVTVKGKINNVNVFYDFAMDVYCFK